MADYFETASSTSNLFYTTPGTDSIHQYPIAYFRPRVPRPQVLRIVKARSKSLDAEVGLVKYSSKISKFSKLATSRDNAKKLFRFITSSHSTPDTTRGDTSPRGTRSRSSSRRSIDESSIAEMQIGGYGRNQHSGLGAVGGPVSGLVQRSSLDDNLRKLLTDSRQSTSSTVASIVPTIGDEKPVASANGISISIALAEPVLYLQGFDQQDVTNRTTTMLRGSFHLKVLKSAKIKAVTLKFRGRAETEWPEGMSE